MISKEELEELKQIYYKIYKKVLTDDEAIDIATRLVNLFTVFTKPVDYKYNQANTKKHGR